MVTLCFAVWRARPAMKPVKPVRAPFDRPSAAIGAFTLVEVMLTMRPNLRAIMPSTVALMSSIGVSMFASSALIHAARSHSRKSPVGGPPALLMRMSGAGHAASAAQRPSSVVMSPTTVVTRTPVALRISCAVFSSASRPRAVTTRFTPSRARANAQPLPRPFDAAQTRAVFPRMPRSMSVPFYRNEKHAEDHQRAAERLHERELLIQPERARHGDADRAERADQRELSRADALEHFRLDEERQHGRERGEQDGVEPYLAGQVERRHRFDREELGERGQRRDRHRISGEAHRAHALYELRAGHEVSRIEKRRGENEKRAEEEQAFLGAAVQLAREDERDARVGDDERAELAPRRATVQEQEGD